MRLRSAYSLCVPAYRRRALRAAPRVPFGRGHAASIPDACGHPLAPSLRAALALSHACVCGGPACCFLHPCTPFSPSRSARAVGACGHSSVFEPVTAALRRAGSGLGQSRPITGVGHATRSVLFPRFFPGTLGWRLRVARARGRGPVPFSERVNDVAQLFVMNLLRKAVVISGCRPPMVVGRSRLSWAADGILGGAP